LAVFISAGNEYLNQDRLAAYMAAKQSGLKVVAISSISADISAEIRLRENVFIDDNVRILPHANIGANTWIMRNTEIGVGAKLGSSCWISSNCIIGDGATLGKNCTLGSGVIIGSGVSLPAWSVINQPVKLDTSSGVTVFIDPMFRAPVSMYEK
ncbi:MAG TPA: UDP-glucose 4-epimerase, partial [Methyloradius sp.]